MHALCISSCSCPQEFDVSHGLHLEGLGRKLQRSGRSAKHKSNIERDMSRHVKLQVGVLI